jgi:hypothetical protein
MLLSFFPLHLSAGTEEVGALFLIIYPGARPTSMGGAFAALANDAHATYFNDAGLGFQQEIDATYMHADWLPGLYPDMYFEFFGFVVPLSKTDVVGGHWSYLNTGKTGPLIDEEGNVVGLGGYETYDCSIKLSYSRQLSKTQSVGFGVKRFKSFLCPSDVCRQFLGTDGGTAYGWAADLSYLYKDIDESFGVGVSLQNYGQEIRYIEGRGGDPLPFLIRAGGICNILEHRGYSISALMDMTKILVGIREDIKDVEYLIDDIWFSMGFECSCRDIVFPRIGYFRDKAGCRMGITYGIGVKLKCVKVDWATDGALYDFPTTNTRLSFGLTF